MDSAPDLRVLVDYADSVGKDELVYSMRLEIVIHRDDLKAVDRAWPGQRRSWPAAERQYSWPEQYGN